MTLYADTADLEQLAEMLDMGIFSGETTNPSIMEKAGVTNYEDHIKEICKMSPGSVSVELTGTVKDVDGLLDEAQLLNSYDPKTIVIKVPMWPDGTGVGLGKELESHNIRVNMTCLMSVNQAMLGCLADSTYVSLFYNRMIDYYGQKGKPKENLDIGRNAANLHMRHARNLIDRFGWKSKIIAGSIRHHEDVTLCLLHGADIVTVPFDKYRKLFSHPKTIEAIEQFDKSAANMKGK